MKKKIFKTVAVFLACNLLFEIIFPTVAYALTGGPSQPEFESFEPAGASEMVDLFSGDFNYNIPLMDVDGYPINLAYHANPTMEQEASWVGLGWNINPGTISRGVRGLPDDFDQDIVTRKVKIKDNETWGVSAGIGVEAVGLDVAKYVKAVTGGGKLGIGVVYNNYKGLGFELNYEKSGAIGLGTKNTSLGGVGVSRGVRLSSQEGSSIYGSAGIEGGYANNKKGRMLGVNVGVEINSRQGLRSFAISSSISSTGKIANKRGTVGIKTSSIVPVGTSTYVPNVSIARSSEMISGDYHLGEETEFVSTFGYARAYYMKQSIENLEKSKDMKGYGYLYSSSANTNDRFTLHDFNREKDGFFYETQPNLPLTNYTYDIYSATAQGLGSSFRPHRAEVGMVHDSYTRESSQAISISLEASVGDLWQTGINSHDNFSHTESGVWDEYNAAYDKLKFQSITADENHEPVYFKAAGEKTPVDAAFEDAMGGENAQSVKIIKIGNSDIGTLPLFMSYGTPTVLSDVKRTKRDKRKQSMSCLTADEANVLGLNTAIISYGLNDFDLDEDTKNLDLGGSTSFVRTTYADSKPHHLSEVTVLKEDGSRYIYGIPVYNRTQVEATFSIKKAPGSDQTEPTIICQNGTTTYSTTTNHEDNSLNNERAIDNYFESKTLPDYAHSYLVTAVLSPDYVDLTGNGPTYDDLGTYTKFNYTKTNTEGNYKWRYPFSATSNVAGYDPGFYSDKMDDKGNYIYGEKDVWYVHSIETKNFIAEFTLENRKDAFGTSGENGGLSTNTIAKRLNKITLYNKQDKLTNTTNAIPIKTVHFEYDYSLCPGVPNNNDASETVGGVDRNAAEGKLTLIGVYFTYGSSSKGAMSPYIFHYADPDHDLTANSANNPAYNPGEIDRWGNYKPQMGTGTGCDITDPDDFTNYEFPYVNQVFGSYTRADADKYASVWNLSDIETPSGGIIKIDYESDTYAYVQDQRASEMVMIDGFNDIASITGMSNKLYDYDGAPILGKPNNQNFLIVTFREEVADFTEFQQKYLGNKDYIYYKILTQIGKETDEYDYVPGYADIDILNSEMIGTAPYTQVAIKLKEVGINDDNSNTKVNPIAKAAWQMGRMYLSKIVFPGSQPLGTNKSAFKGLLNSLQEAINLRDGINKVLLKRGMGRNTIIERSWVRLNSPDNNKIGGGSRVKKILTNDNWETMINSESSFDYGQEYNYNLYDNDDVNLTSSGVASYEPLIGGDEISLRKPIRFSVKNVFAPNDSYFNEEPMGESFFPGAMVGYSRIRVKNIARTGVSHNATGKTEYQYYTSKDFPVITGRTPLEKQIIPPKALRKLTGRMKKKVAASQGYVIKLNDMHGKPKAQLVYAEGESKPISGVEYKYKTKSSANANPPDDAITKNELDNTVLVLDKSGVVTSKIIGRNIDMIADARNFKSETYVRGGGAGMDASASSFGVPVPSFYPYLSSDKVGVRSVVTTKVIQTYGVMQSVVAYDNNSTVTTENVLYDDETGDVLLTKTINDFRDPVYSFTYPAHWVYDGMGPAYKNIGLILKNDGTTNAINTTTGEIDASYAGLVMPGDEIERITYVDLPSLVNPDYLKVSIDPDRYWVSKEESTGDLYLIDEFGNKEPGLNPTSPQFYGYKIIRSGHRNQQGTPIGNITSLDDLQSGSNFSVPSSSAKILNAGAVEYTDMRSLLCGGSTSTETNCVENLGLSQHMENLLNLFGQNNTLMTTNLPINVSPYVAEANPLFIGVSGCASNINYWNYLTSTGTTFSGDFICSLPACTLNLSSSTSITWSNINSFTDLHPILGGTDKDFTVIAHFTGGSTVTLTGNTTCIALETCATDDEYTNCGGIGGTINPYLQGIRGNYRPLFMYNYFADRLKGGTADIRDDGTYASFKPFWSNNASGSTWYKVNNASRTDYSAGTPYDKWRATGKVNKVSRFGNTLETKDPLGRYSASLYGFNHSINTANGNNAHYRQLGYDGFEDYEYNFVMAGVKCQNNHFSFANNHSQVNNTQAHSGRFSMEVPPLGVVRMVRDVADTVDPAHELDDVPYSVKINDCAGTFSPYSNYPSDQKYVLSAWVKETYPSTPSSPVYTYSNSQLVVNVNGYAVTATQKRSKIINGWQKIEYTFTILANTTVGTISIGLINVSGTSTSYYDDVRIHPFNSTMQTFAYDPHSLRLWAELDDRNFGTFYQYDAEGMLVRVNKETEKGLVTVKENRSSLFKK